MATYYWVGSSGNWSDAANHWSDSSGGSPSASYLPTATDDVVFDANSNTGTGAFTVTVDGTSASPSLCQNFSTGGAGGALDGAMTLSLGATAQLDCYGSMTLPATNLTWSGTSGANLFFRSTTTGKTVTTNGVTIATTQVAFSGSGGEWTLGSALTITNANLVVLNGTFYTSASNYSISCNALVSTGSSAATINLNASAVTLSASGSVTFSNTNLTFNAGTSTITCSANSPTFTGGGLTFYNVTFSSASSGTTTIGGVNTFNNLTFTSRSVTGIRQIAFTANQTVSATLTFGTANTAIRRLLIYGTTITGTGVGTAITLTVATLATLADVDFRDITAAGASGTWSGTRIGNGGGNSNITFTAGGSKYWNLAAGGNWSATAWATSSGGTVNVNNFPLAQDTVYIVDTGLTAGNTITIDTTWWLPTIDASARTTAFTLASGTQTPFVFGDYTIPSVATVTGTGTWYFAANNSTQNITTNGVSVAFALNCNGSTNNTVKLLDNFTTTGILTLQQGTLNLNDKTLTGLSFTSTNSISRTIAFGSGGKIVLTATSGVIFTTGVFTNLTVTGTSLVQAINGGAGTRTLTFGTGAISEANSINFEITSGSDIVSLSGTGGAARNINFTGFTGTIDIPTTKVIYGNLDAGNATSITGTSNITFAATSGTKTIRTNGLTYGGGFVFNGVGGTWSLQDALTLSGAITLTNGTLTTNGYAVTASSFSSSNSNVRTLNLGASTVSITGTGTAWNITDPTNMTLNAGTSTITTSGTTAFITFGGGGLTYYNVTFGATYYNTNLTGANTFNNLTLASPAGAGRRALALSANQTVSGTLTCSGSAPNSRPRITGAAGGSTITAAAVSLADTDFGNIIAAGASAPWSGTNLGDGGENTNITFAAPKTVYWNQPAGGNWSDVAWALSSGGSVGANNFPLGQDTVILDDTGVGASSTIVMDYGWLIGTFNASSLTNALTINWNAFGNLTVNTSGNVTLSSAITITYTTGAWGINTLTGTATITTAGVSIPIATVTFNSPSGSMVLGDNFTSTGTVVGLAAGTLDLNGKTLTCVTFDGTFTDLLARTIAFNGGQINVTGNATTVWACEDLTNFSYTGTPTVNFTYSGSTGTRVIQNGSIAGGTEANAVSMNITAGTDGVTLSTTGTVLNLNYTGYSGAGNLPLYIYGNLTLSTTQTITASAAGSVFAATSGTKTITTNGVTIDRPLTFNGIGGTWALQDALTLGSTRTLTLTNGTLQLKAGATSTVGAFATAGTNQKYLQSTLAGTQATISAATGTFTVNYLTIQDSNATGGAYWDATASTNINAGNNIGWDFSDVAVGSGYSSIAFGFGLRI